MTPLPRTTTNQVRSWESSLPCTEWVKGLSDPQAFLENTLHVTTVVRLEDTPQGTNFEVSQSQPLLLNITTKLRALTTLLLATSGITNPAQSGDIIRVQTWADLSVHTSSTWNVERLPSAATLSQGGCNVTEKYEFDTPSLIHDLVKAQVDQTHAANFDHYQRWIQSRVSGSS